MLQNWFALSDPAMKEALYEVASLRTFARLSLGEPISDDTTILNFRHLLEANDLADDILNAVNAHPVRKGLLLKRGSIVDATIIAAPSPTKNADGERLLMRAKGHSRAVAALWLRVLNGGNGAALVGDVHTIGSRLVHVDVIPAC
jgi:IS5 family transposase